jgi:hypothetical protein
MDNAYLIPAAWMGLALVASLVSIRIGISVALIEIGLGVVAGNAFGLGTTEWIDFLASFGAVLLTFLAGAESNPPRCAVTLGKAPPYLPLLTSPLGSWSPRFGTGAQPLSRQGRWHSYRDPHRCVRPALAAAIMCSISRRYRTPPEWRVSHVRYPGS